MPPTEGGPSVAVIPVFMTASFYEVLGLAPSCSADDVRRAYHQAARRCHPDKRLSPSADDEQRFLRVQEAYETLRSAERRRQYDAKLQQDALLRQREQELVVVSDEVPLADMQREVLDEDEVLFTHQCRCGELYEVTDEELQDGVDVVPCTGCSLHIRVLRGSAS
ncbi:Molecular chaperone (DnaJ superfamily) [Phytophthora cinnamomi]|uniref:Molecular chaperone (DnaJ superfamily) n=1 Tax=Phytophthora cinnamomi TaxID=4785 RepID=UPI00355A7540|nr:Molecular chaperone (DnaJ superfamily) [Phytophthora cinnamomi]